jgi:hypothetical protein
MGASDIENRRKLTTSRSNMKELNDVQDGELCENGPMRMTARDALYHRAKSLRAKSDRLMSLVRALDEIKKHACNVPDGQEAGPHIGVGSDADEALWELAQQIPY